MQRLSNEEIETLIAWHGAQAENADANGVPEERGSQIAHETTAGLLTELLAIRKRTEDIDSFAAVLAGVNWARMSNWGREGFIADAKRAARWLLTGER